MNTIYKMVWLAVAMLLQCGLTGEARAWTTNEVGQLLLPAGAPVVFEFDQLMEEPRLTFKLWDRGTNLLAVLTTNDFSLRGITNGVGTFVFTNTFSQGPGVINLTAVGEIGRESLQTTTNILAVKALGKPLPPSAPRKL